MCHVYPPRAGNGVSLMDIGHIVKFHMLVNIFSLGIIGDLQTYTLLER